MDTTILILLTLVGCFCDCLPTVSSSSGPHRIVNGEPVDITEVPYHAGLQRKSGSSWVYSCGAAVVASRAVLTAAHCVSTIEPDPQQVRVVVGTSYRLTGGQLYEVQQVFVHEEYSPLTLENDIALLVTSKTISFDITVSAIAIAAPDLDPPAGTEAIVSGYGRTAFEGPISSVLRAASVRVVAQEACSRAYRRVGRIARGMLCAGAAQPPRDACQGDSGGPLVADHTLLGLVSWGEGCANLTYPGVYTRVSEYHAWINDKFNLI